MEYCLNLKNVNEKRIYPLSHKFYGKDDVNHREISFTNYYMQINKKPFMGISGECHYSRVWESQWEDTILKMKMGGINIISTYIFWIHHEEKEGVFRFDGNRNIRKFLELCKKHGMYVIVRIGPFDHGEVRNGGLPDWLYGKPFEVRSANEGFLYYTRRLYHRLAKQFEGLYFKDGGPIIGTQIENEYMHSAAPWEITTGITNEWVPGGSDGEAYMKALKKIAQEEGILTPFYTCTGWGGAATPVDEMLPLWGGYAFWPWIFYNYRGPHPATPEYIYRDNHNNKVPKTYNFEPVYEPESLPYSCCEMGGGMSCYYYYRFLLPYESVDAMANIKLAGGCNFLGYYMYRGGSNPKGETTPYLNECQCPKISYDYQAAIGEYGQLRPSYFRLRAVHTFMKNYEEQLCTMSTVLPEGSQDIKPEDVQTLRYAARFNGKSGFLFLNNYQDHVECSAKSGERITLRLPEREIVIPDISLAAGEEAILPFEMDVEGYRLIYATAQPLSVVRADEKTTCFFFVPKGMKGEYVWDGKDISTVGGRKAEEAVIPVRPEEGKMHSYTIEGTHGKLEIITLTREESLRFCEIEIQGRKTAVLCGSGLTYDGEHLAVESGEGENGYGEILTYPACSFSVTDPKVRLESVEKGIWKGVKVFWPEGACRIRKLERKKCGYGRYTIQIPEGYRNCKDAILQISYEGDVGHLFQNGELLSDNFCNGAVWEVGLKEVLDLSKETELTILVIPRKQEAGVNVSSTMAGRLEQLAGAVEKLEQVQIKPVQEAVLAVNIL